MNYRVLPLTKLTEHFARLPGIGKKSAQRLAFHVLRMPEEEAKAFAEAILEAREKIGYCEVCKNITDAPRCAICCDETRDRSTICVVEDPRDVIAIERTKEYNGLYHVLGGLISPMDGVGPSDIEIDSLIKRVECDDIHEVILALPTTMEGDTTNFYIYRRLQNTTLHDTTPLKISQIARGVAIGNEIEYTDEITLGRSIVNRIEFKL